MEQEEVQIEESAQVSFANGWNPTDDHTWDSGLKVVGNQFFAKNATKVYYDQSMPGQASTKAKKNTARAQQKKKLKDMSPAEKEKLLD